MTNTTTEPRPFRVGDSVSITSPRFPGTWRITKINRATIKCQQGTRVCNAAPSFLRLVDGTAPAVVEDIPIPEVFHPGEVVRIPRGQYEGVYVVIKQGDVNVSVAKLGGDHGRYVRANPNGLVRVASEDVAIAVARLS